MHFLEALRAANVERNKEWDPNTLLSPLFFVNELCGEVGEACNILKKLDRELLGLPGSRAKLPALQEELADVIICADLLGNASGIVFPEANWPVWPAAERTEYSRYGALIAAGAGRAAALVVNGNRAPLLLLPSVLNGLVSDVKRIGDWLGMDLTAAVTTKFNMTSEKVGLAKRLVWPVQAEA